MSGMNPVVLVSLPNANYLLGTFDTTKFRAWWRSRPFPDDLQNIKKGFHIYGRTHLAIAQRVDGRWAVYRSKNYGIDWTSAWLAVEGETIYDIVLITYGWAILNTSLGFYETVDSGVTWSLILSLPTAPNAPAFCNIGGGDILMCTDGRYIWRSTDISRSWSQVCDSTDLLMSSFNGLGGTDRYSQHYSSSNARKPCIAGANGKVLAANGPFLLISKDNGLNFEGHRHWMADARGNSDWYDLAPPYSLVAGRLWPPRSSPEFIITQILITSTDGDSGEDVTFLIKCNDLVPLSGESQLYARTFVTYGAAGHIHGVYMNNEFYKCIFQQCVFDYGNSQITAYDLPVTGEDFNDTLAFSAQTKVDSSGNQVISLKYSIDGGLTWIDIDVSKLKVGDASEGGAAIGGTVDDNFSKTVWSSGGCCNFGTWRVIEETRRQCQSYEFDVMAESQRTKNYDLDGNLTADHTKSYQQDTLAEARVIKPYQLASYNEGQRSKAYRIDRALEGESTKADDLDAIVSLDVPVADKMDALISGRPKRYYRLTAYLQDRMPQSYFLDCIIERYQLNKRLARIGDEFPQVFDLDLPRGGDEA